jgi:hypothetical protein
MRYWSCIAIGESVVEKEIMITLNRIDKDVPKGYIYA